MLHSWFLPMVLGLQQLQKYLPSKVALVIMDYFYHTLLVNRRNYSTTTLLQQAPIITRFLLKGSISPSTFFFQSRLDMNSEINVYPVSDHGSLRYSYSVTPDKISKQLDDQVCKYFYNRQDDYIHLHENCYKDRTTMHLYDHVAENTIDTSIFDGITVNFVWSQQHLDRKLCKLFA